MVQFDKRLKLLREEAKLSQSELAKQIHVSKSSINMYERGEREPKFVVLEAIADYFNVDMDYLLGKSEVKNRYRLDDMLRQSHVHSSPSDIYTAIKQQFGDDTHVALSLYVQLDEGDRGEVRGGMKQMLKADKYKTSPCSKVKGATAV